MYIYFFVFVSAFLSVSRFSFHFMLIFLIFFSYIFFTFTAIQHFNFSLSVYLYIFHLCNFVFKLNNYSCLFPFILRFSFPFLSFHLGVLGFDSRRRLEIFLFTTAVSRTALGPTQPPIQWIPGALSLGIKQPGSESDHSPPSIAEVKEWVELYLHSSQYVLMALCLVKHRDNFTSFSSFLPCFLITLLLIYLFSFALTTSFLLQFSS
jgi:hypothetical protein